ncbi:hypothetical protein HII36_28485 [Nonomuraea sp. NN258]|uniref:hypothetical protein n=1 Tax=Nonomuraea antri TaxID=2730852 RepID=UPI001569F84D|nr:hypothetical protein [Nonomuraea antri]NRQ35741.1 hypothetical protein [Nonomuraea antri]
MDPDTMRGDGGDVYWRRRMSVLVAVLVVVAVVAWACSSGADGPERRSSAQSSPSPSVSPAVDPLLAGLRTPAATRTASPSPSASASQKAAKSPTPTPSPTRPRRPGAPCVDDDLVLSLQGEERVYRGSARPHYLVTLVNAGPVMCVADVGPRALEVRITSGSDQIWSTADCVSGPGEELKQLKRGVPYVRAVDWDRHRSSANCRATPAAALPGTYVVTARLGGLRSAKGVFHLR